MIQVVIRCVVRFLFAAIVVAVFKARKCQRCTRRFALWKSNHSDLYNQAVQKLGKGKAVVGFVCEECAKKAATTTCACCGKKMPAFSPDTLAFDRGCDHSALYNQAVQELGKGEDVNGFVCESCAKKAATATCACCAKERPAFLPDTLTFDRGCDYSSLYNQVVRELGTGKETAGFVCQECVTKAASIPCARCRTENEVVISYADRKFDAQKFAKSKQSVEHLKTEIAHLRQTLHLDDATFRYEGGGFICASCSRKTLDVARDEAQREFLEGVCQTFAEGGESQPVRLPLPMAQESDDEHCARCGAAVSESDNHAEALKALYCGSHHENDAFIADYLKAACICRSCCWHLRPERVRGADILSEIGQGLPDQPIHLRFDVSDESLSSQCRRCGRPVLANGNFIDSLRTFYENVGMDDDSVFLKQCVKPFLDANCICLECLYHLSPKQAKKDVNFRMGEGWLGTVRGEELYNCDIDYRFPRLTLGWKGYRPPEAIKEAMRLRAVEMGGKRTRADRMDKTFRRGHPCRGKVHSD